MVSRNRVEVLNYPALAEGRLERSTRIFPGYDLRLSFNLRDFAATPSASFCL